MSVFRAEDSSYSVVVGVFTVPMLVVARITAESSSNVSCKDMTVNFVDDGSKARPAPSRVEIQGYLLLEMRSNSHIRRNRRACRRPVQTTMEKTTKNARNQNF